MPILQARCEAEALCAQLNSEDHVDACITADSDAFLYGAKCVVKCLRPNSKVSFSMCLDLLQIKKLNTLADWTVIYYVMELELGNDIRWGTVFLFFPLKIFNVYKDFYEEVTERHYPV